VTAPSDPESPEHAPTGNADGALGKATASSFLLLAGGGSRRMGRDKARLRRPESSGGDDRPLLVRTLEVGATVTGNLILAPGAVGRYRELLEAAGWTRRESRDGAARAPRPRADRDPHPRAGRGARPVASRGRRPEALYRRGEARLRVVPDRRPGAGPLAGLEAGLAAAGRDPVFVAACDLPFLEPAPVRALLELLDGGEGGTPAAAVPEVEGRLHPLCAACTRSVGAVAAACLAEGERRVRALLERIAVVRVPGAELERACGAPAGSAARWTTNLNRPDQLESLEALGTLGESRT